MITGKVVGHEPQVGVVLRRAGQPDIEIVFVIDTGFEGALALPTAAVEALGLPFRTNLVANFADDSSVQTKVHRADIVWHGVEMSVAVLSMGRRPLLGTALLFDKHLGIDFKPNGAVTIGDIPE
jgi:clan AA aspartic protease